MSETMSVKILQTQPTKDKNIENGVVQYKEIGNTKFKLVSYYSGTETYTDIVKNVLNREFERI